VIPTATLQALQGYYANLLCEDNVQIKEEEKVKLMRSYVYYEPES
jgi:hypothetical protein